MTSSLKGLLFSVLATVLLIGFASPHARAQDAAEAREIEYGKDIFKTKATCQFCHKWDGSGDQGYGGNAPSLRKTELNPDQVKEVVKCGRIGSGMPYHDKFAYTDKRCYGATKDEVGADLPPIGNEYLQPREIDAVVKYVFAKLNGRGDSTFEECTDFWGKESRQCDKYKK